MRPLRMLAAVTAATAIAVLTPYAVAHAQSEDDPPVVQTDGDPNEVLETTSAQEEPPDNLDDSPVVDCGMVAEPPAEEGGVAEPADGDDVVASEPAEEPDPNAPVDPDAEVCIAASGPGPVVAEPVSAPEPRPVADTERAPVAKPVKARASFTG